jgi:hypothetical protein
MLGNITVRVGKKFRGVDNGEKIMRAYERERKKKEINTG